MAIATKQRMKMPKPSEVWQSLQLRWWVRSQYLLRERLQVQSKQSPQP
ncbi:hypothetical protein [Adonisia turfae]|nr:hypothetical protein [Adonisia turfae]